MRVVTRWRAAVLVVAAACGVAGCGFPEQDRPVALEIPGSEQAGAGSLPTTERVTVWMIDGDVLSPSVRRVAAPVTPDTVGMALAAGATSSEAARGVRSAIPDQTMVVSAAVAGGTAVVALSREFLDIPAGDQVLALGQIVYTMTDLRGVGRVRFEIDGSAVAVPLPSGTSTEDSVSRDDFVELVRAA